jgi:hypothetical protein
MAGQPLKQALIRALEQRTRQLFEDEPEATHLDYVENWQAAGKTINALGAEISTPGFDIDGEFIGRYLRKAFGSETTIERLKRARERGAERMVDKALDVADKADEDNVQVSRLQVATLQWTAERWNRDQFASNAKGSVTINIGQLSLEAMRAPLPAQLLIDPTIAVDAEIVSIEDAST